MQDTNIVSITGSPVLEVEELKLVIGIGYSEEDTYLAELIDAAVELCETEANTDIQAKDRTQFFDIFEQGTVLFGAPINTVTSVTFGDNNTAATFTVSGINEKRLRITSGNTRDVTVTYSTQGLLNASGDAYIASVKQAVIRTAAWLYANNNTQDALTIGIPTDAAQLLSPHKQY